MAMSRRAAFTLIELLVVMGIMILIMGIGVTGYFGIRRGAEMRGAVSTVRTTLMLARQQAITKRRTVRVDLMSTNTVPETTNYLMRIMEKISDTSYDAAHADAYLPAGIQFGVVPASVTFYPSGKAGSAASMASRDITVREKYAYQGTTPQSATITVWPLTGVTKVTEP